MGWRVRVVRCSCPSGCVYTSYSLLPMTGYAAQLHLSSYVPRTASTQIACSLQNFEPYVLVSRHWVPWYDERFRGYGHNKIQHIMHLVGKQRCPRRVLTPAMQRPSHHIHGWVTRRLRLGACDCLPAVLAGLHCKEYVSSRASDLYA